MDPTQPITPGGAAPHLPAVEELLNLQVPQWPAMPLDQAVPGLEVPRALAVASILRSALQPTVAHLQHLENENQTLRQEFDAFRATQALLHNQGAAPTHRAKFPEPEDFTGDRTKFSAFMSQLRAYLVANSNLYQTDEQRSLYSLQKIRGTAYGHVQAWVDSAGTAQPAPQVASWDVCMQSLQEAFGALDEEGDARRKLKNLRHRTSVDDYAAEYRRLGSQTHFGEATLCSMFEDGLKTEIRDRFVGRTKPATLDGWIREAASVERDLAQLRNATRPQHPKPTQSTTPHTPRDPNAMDLDKLSQAERMRRRTLGLCFYCGQAGHRTHGCPLKGKPAPARAAVVGEVAAPSGPPSTNSTPAPPPSASSGGPPTASTNMTGSSATSAAPGNAGGVPAMSTEQVAALNQFVQWAQAQSPGSPTDF